MQATHGKQTKNQWLSRILTGLYVMKPCEPPNSQHPPSWEVAPQASTAAGAERYPEGGRCDLALIPGFFYPSGFIWTYATNLTVYPCL